MVTNSRVGGRGSGLTDRRSECGVLDRLVDNVRASESRALVVRGDAGVGKTVLLEYLAGQARGCRVARAVGVQSEIELAWTPTVSRPSGTRGLRPVAASTWSPRSSRALSKART
jgi:hypothetical protein